MARAGTLGLILVLSLLVAPGCSSTGGGNEDGGRPDGAVLPDSGEKDGAGPSEAGADGASDTGPGKDAVADAPPPDATADAGGDAVSPDSAPDTGAADAAVIDARPRDPDRCETPQVLTRPAVNGTVKVTASTASGTNSIAPNCSERYSYSGNDRFFAMELLAGEAYAVRARPLTSWDMSLMAWPTAVGCAVADVNKACTGHISDTFRSGTPEALVIRPTKTALWTFAVDSRSSFYRGSFEITVTRFPALSNDRCARAIGLGFTKGKAKVAGYTTGLTDEFGGLRCGRPIKYSGPQAYYRFRGKKGNIYIMKVTPGFGTAFYTFPGTTLCKATAIEKACGSGGKTGNLVEVPPGTTGELRLRAPADDTYFVALDSPGKEAHGVFSLEIEEFAPPTNDTCKTAIPLVFKGKFASVRGHTRGARDEIATLTCGAFVPLRGPQLYYSFTAVVGDKVKITLSPSFAASFYVFPAAVDCAKKPGDVEAACSGKVPGAGAYGGVVSPTTSKTLEFVPKVSGTFLVAVDSTDPAVVGGFTLDLVRSKIPTTPSVTAPFSWDFESSSQKLFATEDWEWGAVAFTPDKRCDKAAKGPSRAHSGTKAWGTLLSGCYRALDNAGPGCINSFSDDDSELAFKVAIPASWKTATLTYWAWDDYDIPFDFGGVYVDGRRVEQYCRTGTIPKTRTWTRRTVDLSSYIGKSVRVAFHFMADFSKNLAGWYIDDISVTGR